MQKMRQKRRFVKIVLIAVMLVMGGGISVANAGLGDAAVSMTYAIRYAAIGQQYSSLAIYYNSSAYLYNAWLHMKNADLYAEDAYYYALYSGGTYAYYARVFAGYAWGHYGDARSIAWSAYLYKYQSYIALTLLFAAYGHFDAPVSLIYAAWGS